MKTILTIVITALVVSMLGYILVPMLIQREIAPIKSELTRLQGRLKTSEDFIKAEEEAKHQTGLKADSKLPDVVKTVNKIAAGQKSIEDLMQVRFADLDARLIEMKAATEGAMSGFLKQAEETTKKTNQRFQDNEIQTKIDDARIRIVKIKSEILARNVGVAKGELDLLFQTLSEAKKLAGDDSGRKASFDRLQGMVKEIKEEMESNIVAATDRIDLLWHELAKLSLAG